MEDLVNQLLRGKRGRDCEEQQPVYKKQKTSSISVTSQVTINDLLQVWSEESSPGTSQRGSTPYLNDIVDQMLGKPIKEEKSIVKKRPTNTQLQETTQYVTIKPKTTSKVTIRDPIDRTRETAQTTTTQRSFTSGGSYNYDHDHDGDHEHDYHRRRRRWYYPNLYYSPYAWMDSYYPVYPYDPTMNPVVREALNYKCMWDPDSNPELCDRVFASEIIRSNPWYNPWGWGFPSWRWY